MGDVAQSFPWIYVVVDSRKVDQWGSIIEMEGKICDQIVSVLIDLGSNYTYISPKNMEHCQLAKESHEESCLVQLAARINIRVENQVRPYPLELNGMPTIANFNVLPLDAYNEFLEMDSFFKESIECLNEIGEQRVLWTKLKPTSFRSITVMEAKRSCKRGCMIFIVQIRSVFEANNNTKDDVCDILPKHHTLNQIKMKKFQVFLLTNKWISPLNYF